MAVDPTHLTSSYDNVDRTTYTSASITPTANRWLVIDVYNRVNTGTADAVTITGLSLTWVQEKTQLSTSSLQRVSRVYAWTGTSPGSGTLSIACGSTQLGCAWIVYEMGADVDTSDPFVQSVSDGPAAATSISLTLAAYGSANNRPLIAASHNQNEGKTPEAGYTEIADVFGGTPNSAFATAFHPSSADTTPSFSWTTSSAPIAIASEIKAAAAGPQNKSITNAAETDSAQALTFVKPIHKTLGIGTETEAAQALAYSKPIRKSLTAATETDVAQALTFSGPQFVSLTAAIETDQAVSLSVTKPIIKILGVAAETEAAVGLTKFKRVSLGAASESDIAQALELDEAALGVNRRSTVVVVRRGG